MNGVKLVNLEECANQWDVIDKQIKLSRSQENCGIFCIILITIVREDKKAVGVGLDEIFSKGKIDQEPFLSTLMLRFSLWLQSYIGKTYANEVNSN